MHYFLESLQQQILILLKTICSLMKKINVLLLLLLFPYAAVIAQVVINEGSNKNYTTIADENGEFPDWIELYNSGNDTMSLSGYSLTDDPADPLKWVFPAVQLMPGEYKTIFCSGKDRKPVSGFIPVHNSGSYNPVVGWNTHQFTTPFFWDGLSNILINSCSYSSTGYTTNSVFNQTATPYSSCVFAFQDGSPYICATSYGNKVNQRPNVQLNNIAIDAGTIQNSPYDYPAPYGNWYWAAKNQFIIRASELTAAGLTAGTISSLGFDVAATDPNTYYDYIDIYMKLVSVDEVSSLFETVDTNSNLHTNFSIAKEGENIYLYSPSGELLSNLFVNAGNLDNSTGSMPDSSSTIVLFSSGTPSASNNNSLPYAGYLAPPTFSVPAGMYDSPFSVSINNPNGNDTEIHYTLDGSDPTPAAALYTGQPVEIYYANVLKARAFSDTLLPSAITVSSYLLGVDHVTPVLSVVTDQSNLYGATGIFDNWPFDWEKAAYVEYFDSAHQLIFSSNAGIQIDGGAGGSRSNPQHSFRVELDDAVLGDSAVNYPLIPNRPYRNKYGKFYLRNGSNQYLVYPYKDACQTEIMGGETNNYYSAWRPVSVYINGGYFGLYELREKLDAEYFETIDNADSDSTDILSQSFWYGGILRPVLGSVDGFYGASEAFNNLDPIDTSFWSMADQYFDMAWYNDYIIAESWMGNVDWPWNNIKIYRSDKTDFRWRFCLIDLELSMSPNGWTDCYFDHIEYMLYQDPANPYIGIWLKGMQNQKFRNYFINRYADLMNTSYDISRTSAVEQSMFSQTVLEMQNEYLRWGDPNNVNQQMTDFINRHNEFQFQLSERNTQVRNHIQYNLSLEDQVEVTLNAIPAGAGKIKISTIIPGPLPWTGVYFNGNPVTITAIPNPGFEFAFWDTNAVLTSIDTTNSITLNVTDDAVFNAVFTSTPYVGRLSVSELNYHSDNTRDAGDWIELHNYGNGVLDISGWKITDGVIYHNYVFPAGTLLQPGSRLVVAEDTMKFHSQHPGINVFGQFGFGLNNATESVSIYDYTGEPVLSFHYEDSIPWPQAADGFGRTLELYADSLDPALPESWFEGCIGGSPGGPYVNCPEELIFSEINYNSSPVADAGDWVELFNTGSTAIDVSGWIFSDEEDTHLFSIPDSTILLPSGYFVLFSDSVKFISRFPAVSNKSGPFAFGLKNNSDALRLYDEAGRLYQSVIYSSTVPWPQGAAGNGSTLELTNPFGNFCNAASWIDGCPEGSPGSPYIIPCFSSNETYQAHEFPVRIFPNPSDGILYVTSEAFVNASINIKVYSLLGEMVYSSIAHNQSSQAEVDLFILSDGMYILQVNCEKVSHTQKIMISSR
jgi:hypothetical protein